jgi:hypothetical protein
VALVVRYTVGVVACVVAGVGDCANTKTAAAKKRITRASFFTSVLDLGEMRSG